MPQKIRVASKIKINTDNSVVMRKKMQRVSLARVALSAAWLL